MAFIFLNGQFLLVSWHHLLIILQCQFFNYMNLLVICIARQLSGSNTSFAVALVVGGLVNVTSQRDLANFRGIWNVDIIKSRIWGKFPSMHSMSLLQLWNNTCDAYRFKGTGLIINSSNTLQMFSTKPLLEAVQIVNSTHTNKSYWNLNHNTCVFI